ncbi:hypothetical protein K432DRAFT_395251 [Lepidopterella palustris CBS 459.81]|uniref:BTB domain-containing protein n=1 Tax=Lepidopterella palustris CBS 459.81 TaxID=1314670 RepID=A0A8E2E5R2_9PEZI|nr:hypothetical protein K432DRAFT_395251 [Lepidopterella palustris CBS 459.81]
MEESDRVIRLPADKPDIFELFVQFLHTRVIFSKHDGDRRVKPNATPLNFDWVRLAELYVIGEKLQATELKNAVVDSMIEMSGAGHPTGMATSFYTYTDPSAKIRRLYVEFFVWENGKLAMETGADVQDGPRKVSLTFPRPSWHSSQQAALDDLKALGNGSPLIP